MNQFLAWVAAIGISVPLSRYLRLNSFFAGVLCMGLSALFILLTHW